MSEASGSNGAPILSRTERAGLEVLHGTSTRRGIARVLPFIGPAFIAAVAYIDPGNFATNIGAGAQFGYKLLWVVVYANVLAMIVQTLAAKLGIATGRNLPELMREHFPRWIVYPLWVVAEIMAMATDLAEFVGAAVGFRLLFGIPLLLGAVLTGLATFGMLYLQRRGFRPLEALITVLVLVVAVSYVIELFLVHPDAGLAGYHAVVPYFSANTFILSAGILGATVMPHVVYLHSALTQNRIRPRTPEQARILFRYTLADVLVAMPLAGLVNGGMLIMAAVVFHQTGHTHIADIGQAEKTLRPLLGQASAVIFAISLLASGLSSSTVGTMAGQVVMQGFVGFSMPLWFRRLLTMAPSFVVIGLNLPTATTLVASQVVLSVVLAFAVIPLVMFTSRRDIMGVLTNHVATTVIAWIGAGIIVALNAALIFTTVGGNIPGLSG
ncbi:MAG TPA: Nramp family divalent metal transporter [Chloroflexota bacterium]|nr:Nramp family divalent metal transporter [Chloroflexota bacterium]